MGLWVKKGTQGEAAGRHPSCLVVLIFLNAQQKAGMESHSVASLGVKVL